MIDRQLATECSRWQKCHGLSEGSAAVHNGVALASELRQALHAHGAFRGTPTQGSTLSRARKAPRETIRSKASARARNGESTCLQANTLMHRLLRNQMDHLVALLEPHRKNRHKARRRASEPSGARTRAKHGRVRPATGPGTWQILRPHFRQNHSAMYSSQTEQNSSPIVSRPPTPAASSAGAPCAGCGL